MVFESVLCPGLWYFNSQQNISLTLAISALSIYQFKTFKNANLTFKCFVKMIKAYP